MDEETQERIQELEKIAYCALEEIKILSKGSIIYDYRIERFVEL